MAHWSGFSEAYFSGLSNMLKCSGGLQMAVIDWTGIHPAGNHLKTKPGR